METTQQQIENFNQTFSSKEIIIEKEKKPKSKSSQNRLRRLKEKEERQDKIVYTLMIGGLILFIIYNFIF